MGERGPGGSRGYKMIMQRKSYLWGEEIEKSGFGSIAYNNAPLCECNCTIEPTFAHWAKES